MTMKFVDAHIHLADPEYKGHVDEIVSGAKNADLEALVSNAMDLSTSIETVRLMEKYPNFVYAALGIHPWNVNVLKNGEIEHTIDFICEQYKKKSIVAIGEIGLDCKYEEIWDKQLLVFDKMLRLAEKLNLPVIIHSRGTSAFIVDMLPSYNLRRVLMHWFSHPMSALTKAIAHGYYITEGPPVVYSKGIREVVRRTPISNLLTETDGPVIFRKPPFNSQMTRPSFVEAVVDSIAEVKKVSREQVAEQIMRNFQDFFDLKLKVLSC